MALTVLAVIGIRVQAQKLMPPIYGEARIDVTKPATKVSGNEIVTTVLVKNMEAAPIAGFQIDEYWYDSNGTPMGATTYRHPKPLQARRGHHGDTEDAAHAAHEPQQGGLHARARHDQADHRPETRRAEDVERTTTSDYRLRTDGPCRIPRVSSPTRSRR